MKTKPIDAMEIQQNSISEAVQMAANNFMILQVTVGRWKGKRILTEASRKAVADAGASAGDIIVPLLGDHDHELQKVYSAYSKVRTIFDRITMKYQKPARMGFVGEVPEILSQLMKQTQIAEKLKAEFLPRYDQFIKEAIPSHGKWGSEVKSKIPTVRELDEKFYVTIHDPKPMPVMDMERYGCVPTDTMGKIVAASNQALAQKFEEIKNDTIDSALKAVEKVATQLNKDAPRLHASVIEDAKIASSQLRNICNGYDKDIRLSAIADTIDNEIINVDEAAQWHDSMTKKWEARDAATKTATNLKRMQTAPPVAQLPADDTLVAGGLLADLL